MRRTGWLVAGTLVWCGLLGRGAAEAGEYRVPLMPKAPTVDGKVEADEWAGATRLEGFVWQGALERRQVTGLVGATSTHLYFGILSQLPAEGSILADVKRDSENLVFDDSVEVWVDPTPGQESGKRFQMLANPLGFRWYKLHPYGKTPEDPSWRGEWTVANGFHDGQWLCEVAVPVEQIAPGRKVTEGAWGVNLCRNWKRDWAWSCLGGDGYKPSEEFTFVPDGAPAASFEQRGDPFVGDVKAALVLRNTTARPLAAQATLLLERDLMPELKQNETLQLAPGESKEVALQVSDRTTRKYKLTATATAGDGGAEFFSRHVEWAAAAPWQWTTKKRVIPPLDFQFAYYPYLNALRILGDTSNLPKDAVLEELTATIRHPGGPAIRTVKFDQLRDGKQEVRVELPALSGSRATPTEEQRPGPEGQYEIALQARGKNVPAAEVVKPFERTVFEWEHNSLGTSTKVYPPFTPIRVTGQRVSTVLRDHEMNGAGLWDHVVAAGQELLAGPMRWDVAVAGAPVTAAPQRWKFTKTAEHTAVAQGGFTAGPLQGQVISTWDYDGLMRVDLTLLPSAGQQVDALTLTIPLRSDQATHYHAMGDGIRNTLYARLPAGEGVVWAADKVACNDIPRSFCSYLYLGTPVRGLCWFAENDRHWGWDPRPPSLEVARAGGQVVLRVHLLNRPEVITAPRTLTFGLLAAPVKPRLSADWRHKYRRDRYSLLGTDINWLSRGDCGAVYPAGKDLYLWEMLKRGNREHLSDADIQKVVERGAPYFEPYGAERAKTFAAHARYNLTARYGTKMIFYYNRASYQLAGEFQTFQDEWCLRDWRAIGKGNGVGEIQVVPSESYIDYHLYWYGKSFDLASNQGVYWDNWFFNGSYNTATTGAYRRPDGTVVPSTGIWGLRELAKRTFQYMNERGMLPITMAHMTSTGILPLLSFCTVQYDWEWKYSEGDVQYRFPREYILMVTDGELAGAWPVLLNDHGKLEDDPWTGRTFAAVCLVHELDCPYPAWTKTGQQQLALFQPVDEILAQPGVQAYRYWDDRPQPVVADSPDLPTIVYAVKGKQAVFAVVSYADQDLTANLSVDPVALGFTGGYQVLDTETGQELPVTGNRLSFSLKKHDVRVCKVVPK